MMKKESFDGLIGAGLVCLIVAAVIFIKSIFFGFSSFSADDSNDLVNSEQKVKIDTLTEKVKNEDAITTNLLDDNSSRYYSRSNSYTTYYGPRGGVYHYSKSGKKVYHKKKR